jgi:hypothetical protein
VDDAASVGTGRRLDPVEVVPADLLKEAEVILRGRHFGIFSPGYWSVLPTFFLQKWNNRFFFSEALYSVVLFPHTSLAETAADRLKSCLVFKGIKQTNKLHGLSPRVNYTDRATAASRRSVCQLLRIKGATWSA